MMRSRSRSRSRSRQQPNYRRSRSRSPYFAGRGKNHRYIETSYREKIPHRDRDYQRRDDYREHPQTSLPWRGSPGPHSSRHRSPSPRNTHQRNPEMKRDYEYQRRTRSPARRSPIPYNQPYHHNQTPASQRLAPDPMPRENCIFIGPEGTVINLNELKKITVDIRRNLPRGVVPTSHASLNVAFNPEDIVIVRRVGEGSRPIFDREELRPRPVEERVIKLASDKPELTGGRRSPSPRSQMTSPHDVQRSPTPPPSASFQDQRPPKDDNEADLRYRLLEKKNEDMKERTMDPNYVPKYHNEHDNRDRFHIRGRGYRGGFRGGYRGNYNNFRGQNFRGHQRGEWRGSFRGRQRSPDWQHDLYDQIDDAKPTSTTTA